MRIFKNAWFVRFARNEQISAAALLDAVDRAEKGLIDANLGGGAIKQRIARPNAGRSGGFRTVVFYRRGERAFFVFGFAKSVRDNIGRDEEAQFRKAARLTLALSDEQLDRLVSSGRFEEVLQDGE
jgi:hypothetical protein